MEFLMFLFVLCPEQSMTPRDIPAAKKIDIAPTTGDSVAAKFLDEAVSFAGAAKRSFLYSAVQSPLSGATEIVDQVAGTKLAEKARLFDAPAEAPFGSAAWHGQQVGAGLGIAADFLVVKKIVGASSDKVLAGTSKSLAASSLDGSLDSSLAKNSALLAIGRSAFTGAVYQGVFTSGQSDENNFWQNRFENAGAGAVTFATLAGAGIGLRSTLGKAQAESSLLSKIIKSDAAIGTMAGVPAGLISAEASSLLSGNGSATKDAALRSAYGFVVAGGPLGLAHALELPKVSNVDSHAQGIEAADATPGTAKVAHQQTEVSDIGLAASGLTSTQWGGLKVQFKMFNKLDINAQKLDMTRDLIHEITSQRRETLSLQRHSSDNEKTITVTVPSTVLTIGGRATEIVIPDGDWHITDGVRAWREFASKLGVEEKKAFDGTMQRSSQAHAGFEANKSIRGYSNAVLPEQLGAFLDELPDSSIIERVVLWPDGGYRTAADAHGAIINLYRTPEIDADDLRHVLFHEWSHVADNKTPNCLFTYAAELEKAGYYSRKYAQKNNAENLAVHLGEDMLSPDADDFFILTKSAPIRSVALAEILKLRLASAEAGGKTSPYHQQFAGRIDYVSTEVVPEAMKALSEHLKGDYNTKMNALLFIGQVNETDPELAKRLTDQSQLQQLANGNAGASAVEIHTFTDLLNAAKQHVWLEQHPEL